MRTPYRVIDMAVLAVGLVACGDAAAPEARLDWPTAEPAEVGMDADMLSAADRHIRDSLPNINAFLVVRHGKLVLEGYYQRTNRGTLHPTRSMTKSVVGALTGVALAQGWLDSVEQPLATVLPEYFDATVPVDRRYITPHELLTMSSGLAYDSLGTDPINGSWISAFLHGPSIASPGRGSSTTAATPTCSQRRLRCRTGRTLADLAVETLFRPLGIEVYTWPADPEGFSIGSTGLYLSAQDQAKLGELYLRDGVWEGQRLLPVGWVEASTTPWFDLTYGDGYGYLWWTIGGLETQIYAAVGYRQQWILVLPEFDLVVVIASESSNLRGPEREHFHLLYRYVLPAIPGAPVPP